MYSQEACPCAKRPCLCTGGARRRAASKFLVSGGFRFRVQEACFDRGHYSDCFPLTHHLGDGFDHGKIMRPVRVEGVAGACRRIRLA